MAGQPRRVIGIDLSLTGTGLSAVSDGYPGAVVKRVTSAGKLTDTLADRTGRLRRITREITTFANWAQPVMVAIEGPSYGNSRESSGSRHDRSGLWWLIVERLNMAGYPVVEIAPASVKLFATGKGNADKGAVIDACARRFPEVDTGGDNNMCDALIIAAMAARRAGFPIDAMPKVNLGAMDKVRWPAMVSDD